MHRSSKRALPFVLVGLFLHFSQPEAGSAELDAASAEALHKTQQLLKDRNQREKALEENDRTRFIGNHVKSLSGGGETEQGIYELSADLLSGLAAETGGDPALMLKALEEAKRDPASLERKFTPEQRARLRAIAEKIQQQEQPPGKTRAPRQ